MLMCEYYGHDRGATMAGKGSPQTLAKVIAMRARDSNALRLLVRAGWRAKRNDEDDET